MAVTLSAPIVQPGLRWRQHIAGVFNGAGLQQHLPVVFAGVGRKGGRHHQQFSTGTRQMAVELREANVVANREPNAAETGKLRHRRQGITSADRG